MPAPITGIPQNGFPDTLTGPVDGDSRNAASVQVPFQEVADALAILRGKQYSQLDSLAFDQTLALKLSLGSAGGRCAVVAPNLVGSFKANDDAERMAGLLLANEGNQIIRSLDGHRGFYANGLNPIGAFYRDGFFSSPGWLLVGQAGAIIQSFDGLTWVDRSIAETENLQAVTLGFPGGVPLFVTVAGSGTIWTSPDTVVWTPQTSPNAEDLEDVTWDGTNDVFVAVGEHRAATSVPNVITSPDGIIWTQQDAVSAANLATDSADRLYGVSYGLLDDGSGIVVAVGTSDNGPAPGLGMTMVLWSTDGGVNWTRVLKPPRKDDAGTTYRDVEFIGGRFVACGHTLDGAGSGLDTPNLMSSRDGKDWRGHLVCGDAWSPENIGSGGPPLPAEEVRFLSVAGTSEGVVIIGDMESAAWDAPAIRTGVWVSPGESG